MATHPRRSSIIVLIAALSFVVALSGCEKPPIVNGIGTAVSQNGVSVKVTEAKLIRPEFEGPRGAVVSEKPVLRLSLTVNNQSESPLSYDLGWNQTVSTQSRAILMFAGSDPETAMVPGFEVTSIDLTDVTYPDDPVTERKHIAPGTSLEDQILFQAPAGGVKELLISIPPLLFPDSDMPGYIVIPWSPNEVKPLPSVGFGELYSDSEYSMKVTKVEDRWVRLKDSSDKEGLSKEPLLRVDFELTNKGEDPVTYRPTRERGAIAFPMLIAGTGDTVPRASFEPVLSVVDQIEQREEVPPGESIKDFMLFQQPDEGVNQLRFVFPGKRFGASGQARVDLDYTRTTPEKPEPWKGAEEEERDDGDDSEEEEEPEEEEESGEEE